MKSVTPQGIWVLKKTAGEIPAVNGKPLFSGTLAE
jgi:hypothetical protein